MMVIISSDSVVQKFERRDKPVSLEPGEKVSAD